LFFFVLKALLKVLNGLSLLFFLGDDLITWDKVYLPKEDGTVIYSLKYLKLFDLILLSAPHYGRIYLGDYGCSGPNEF
jgi:hypothetical protein